MPAEERQLTVDKIKLEDMRMGTPKKLHESSPAPGEPLALPPDVDRRSFLMRSAVIGAAAVMTGTTWTAEARAQQAAKEAAAPKLGATQIGRAHV